MGTRSYIAVETEPNKFIGVYCHWDGYLTHNGDILLKHYNSKAKATELVNHGGISTLGPKIGVKHEFGIPTYKEDEPHYNECTFYHRDRGEELSVNKHGSLRAVCKAAEQHGGEYVYIFTIERKWMYGYRGVQMFGLSDGTKIPKLYPLTKHAIALEQWSHDCYRAEQEGKPKPPKPVGMRKRKTVKSTRVISLRRTGGRNCSRAA